MRTNRWHTLLTALCLLVVGPSIVLADPPDLGAPAGSEATAKIGPRADHYELPVAAFTREERPVLSLRGSVIWNAYRLEDPEVTVAAVAQGFREKAGDGQYEILLDCASRICGGFDFRFGISLLPAPAMRMDVQNFEQLSIRRVLDNAYASILISRVLGAVYVQVVTVEPTDVATPLVAAPKPPKAAETVAPTRPSDPDLMDQLVQQGHVQLDGVDFDTGGAQLSDASGIALDRVATLLINAPDLNVVIVGHSDNQGGLDPNIALSRSRADAVLEALVARGVAKERLEARGIGYLSPLVSNATPEGRARNRRVEIVLSD